MNFETNIVYTDKLAPTFGDLSPRQIAKTFRDGRVSAFLVHEHLLTRFKESLKQADKNEYPADCVQMGQDVIIVRMVTDGGVLVNRHKQNGVGRKYNRQENKKMLKRIIGFIFVDVTNAPQYMYSFVPKWRVPERGRLSCELAQSVISLAPHN